MTEIQGAVLTPLFRQHTRRPRLTTLLDEATAQAILVIAPAGYGKTTLAQEWLQGRDDIAWYQATAASADLAALSNGLANAVSRLVPDAGERVHQRLRVGDETERLARPLAELLAEDLEPWPADGIIVLDDYHLVAESKPVEEFVDWLLMLARIRVVVTSRRRPSWATARRFLYGEAVEIGREELTMTDDEAARVLEGRSTDSVRALVRQAEGWPALIGLAALSADLEFPPEKVSDSLYRYFAEEVFRREPPEVQRFMLLASIPLSLDARVARDVLGLADPESTLERLRDEGLVQHLPGGELRFHPLLREFHHTRLLAEDPQTFGDKAQLVIEDAVEHGRWEEAFQLSLQIDPVGEAAEIAGRAARSLLASGQSETLEKWLSACGAAAVTVPGAALARAELLIRKGEMAAATAIAQDAIGRLPSDHADLPRGCNILGRALHFTSHEHEAFVAFQRACELAGEDDDLKDALWGLVLTATEIAPDTIPIYLDELGSQYSDDLDVRFRLAVGRYARAEQSPSIAGEWAQFEGLLPCLEHSKDPIASSSFLATAASFAKLRGRYAVARELAQRALCICSDLRLDFGRAACLAYQAEAEIGLRHFTEASRTLRSFAKSRLRKEDPYLYVEGVRIAACLLASKGALADALATEKSLPQGPLPPRALGVYFGSLAIIHAAAGETTRARAEGDMARQHSRNIEARYCSALGEVIATGVEGNHDEFRKRASEAILSCGDADYLDGLVLAYRVYPQLLEAGEDCAEVARVLRAALSMSNDHRLARRAGLELPSETPVGVLGALTTRELEVVELLSEGLTNKEIAQRLFIEVSTTKVHIRHILDKFGVPNRIKAILIARELLAEDEMVRLRQPRRVEAEPADAGPRS
ncbi:MAG TPA: LuxR C-terminal-related transcriptional regulator [Thermoplasmata archaeon]